MAKKSNENLKRASLKRKLLLGFVLVSVLMIGAIWIEGIVEPDPAAPSYYRDTYQVDDSVYITAAADALKYNPEPVGTPEPNENGERHRGSGQGQGAGQSSGQNSNNGEGSGN